VWHVYILRCGDGTLYTGITTDVPARLEAHRAGRGAKYTKGRGPLELIHQEAVGSKSDATKREAEIKRMGRAEKLRLVDASTPETD
jgi:putative endonuclease